MTSSEYLKIFQDACQAKSASDFIHFFASSLQEKFGLFGTNYMVLNEVKDQLLMINTTLENFSIGQAFSMPIKNLHNPIVYSLVTNEPYLMQPPYNFSDAGDEFNTMISMIPTEMAIQCIPISLKKMGIHGVFVLIASSSILKNMMASSLTSNLLTLFSSILSLYQTIEENNQEKNQLKMIFLQKTATEHKKTIQQHIAKRFLGNSLIIQGTWDLLSRAATSEMAIMLRGETGVGKDLAATLIHDYSNRANEPFIVVNCAAIPENLLESELFGHNKGAFTGATHDKKGMIGMANKGTLFLDEIGDLSPLLQAKLLRVLQEKRFLPIGGKKEIHSDFRLITATHRPLERWVRDGKFRQDLFYRINQFCIMLPALRNRKEDIPKIIDYFINEYMKENNVHIAGCSKSALKAVKEFPFPGNVRELKNIIYQACLFVDGKDRIISKQNIMERLANTTTANNPSPEDFLEELDVNNNSLSKAREMFEMKMIKKALIASGGSRTKAAIKLDIPKRTLAYKCKRWNINVGQ